jgi:Toastrack DUF4097
MKLTLLLLFIVSAGAFASTEEKLSQRFAVQPGGTVVVDVEFGTIDISTNATSEVVVDVVRKIGRKKKADEAAYLRDHPVKFTQSGNTVKIESHGSQHWFSWGGRAIQNEATYTLHVPAQFSARLNTGGGDVEVADLTGEVKVGTGGGGLGFARLHGRLQGETGGGGVNARDCEGALTLRTGGGGVEVIGGAGSLDGTTGGGGVSVKNFQGPAHVSTGGGGVTVEKVQGAVDASTGGGSVHAVLPSELSDPVKLSTRGGGITVSAPKTAAFNLDARTEGGGVTTDLPVAVVGKMEEGCLVGPVNGGGKTVQLHSGGGDIHLKKL